MTSSDERESFQERMKKACQFALDLGIDDPELERAAKNQIRLMDKSVEIAEGLDKILRKPKR